jgi:hypothetical protein
MLETYLHAKKWLVPTGMNLYVLEQFLWLKYNTTVSVLWC